MFLKIKTIANMICLTDLSVHDKNALEYFFAIPIDIFIFSFVIKSSCIPIVNLKSQPQLVPEQN